jgi:hypothetical protein
MQHGVKHQGAEDETIVVTELIPSDFSIAAPSAWKLVASDVPAGRSTWLIDKKKTN